MKRENWRVCLVHLVYLVHLVSFVQPNKQNEQVRLADRFNCLLVFAGGSVVWSVALSGWGCWRSRRGFRGGLRSVFLVEIDDRGRKRPFFGKQSQTERSQHEDSRDDDCEFAQKVRRSTAAEDGLAGASK